MMKHYLLFIGAFLVLTGCGSKANHNSEYKVSLSVSAGTEQSIVLDTTKVSSTCGLSACRHLYEGLFRLGENGRIEKGQVRDYKVNSDKKTYFFYLRDDIFWSDGEPVIADDFVFAWKRLVLEGEGYASLLDMIVGAEEIRSGEMDINALGVKALNDKTLLVELEKPCDYLFEVLAFPPTYPIREDVVRVQGDLYATDADKAVYNGAYRLAEWRHQDELRMTSRKEYYDNEKIQVDKIVWKLFSNENTMLASFESGDIIYSDSFPSEETSKLEKKGLCSTPGINTYAVMVNLGKNGADVLKDKKIRKALCLAIDRERMVALSGVKGIAADAYIPKGIVNKEGEDFHKNLKPWYVIDDLETSCKEARQLLKEAGYPNGKNFPVLKYLVNNTKNQTLAEMVVNDWKEFLGIDSITIVTNTDSFWADRADGNYDLAHYSWNMDFPECSNILGTMITNMNDADFQNELFDLTLQEAQKQTYESERWKYYRLCENILAEELPIFPLYYGDNMYLFDKDEYENLIYAYGNFYFGYVKKKEK